MTTPYFVFISMYPADFAQQQALIQHLMEQVEFYKGRCDQLSRSYDQLLYQFKQFQRDRFGCKAERYEDSTSHQQNFFEEENIDHKGDNKLTNNNIIEIAAYQRTQRSVKQYAHLPRRTVIVPVAEAQRVCACGRCKVVVRYETKELFYYQPAVYEIQEQKREVMACPAGCEGSIMTALNPPHILPKTRVTEALLAHIIVSKVDDRQPLYHLEK